MAVWTNRVLRYVPPPNAVTGRFLISAGGAGTPALFLRRPAAPADERVWGLQVGADNVLRLAAVSDDLVTSTSAIEVARAGTTPTSIALPIGTVRQRVASGAAAHILDAPAGQAVGLSLRRGDVRRWSLFADDSPETGGNAGSDLRLYRWTDSGTNPDSDGLVRIRRSDGLTTVSRPVSLTGTGGDLLYVNATQQGQHGTIMFQRNAVPRWSLGVTNATESGGNTGSHFEISRFADSGGWISAPFAIERNTGKTVIRHGLTLENNTLSITNATGGHLVNIDAPTGEFALLSIYRNGTRRWALGMNSTAESGGNAGSHFEIRRYGDSGGAAIDVPLSINRQTGVVTVTGQARGVVVVPSNTYTTIYVIPVTVTMGIIQVGLIGNPGGGPVDEYSAVCLWQRQVDGLCYLRTLWAGAGCSLRVWGSAIEYYQASGAPQGVHYGVYELYR